MDTWFVFFLGGVKLMTVEAANGNMLPQGRRGSSHLHSWPVYKDERDVGGERRGSEA